MRLLIGMGALSCLWGLSSCGGGAFEGSAVLFQAEICAEKPCVELTPESLTGPITAGMRHVFRGVTSEEVAAVEILVDGWRLRRTEPVSRAFTIVHTFGGAGERRRLTLRGFGRDGTTLVEKEHFISVLGEMPPTPSPDPEPTPVPGPIDSEWEELASRWGVHLQIPEGLDLTAYRTLAHTARTPVDRGMSEFDGRKLFFGGLLPQANDKLAFNRAVDAGIVPRHGSAQCAVTTAAVLEHASLRAAFGNIGAIFAKPRRDAASDPLACTDQIETELRRLGWYYYAKERFVAPRAAIGLLKGRYTFCGTPSHSGHIYTILQDNGVGQRDRIADNGGYDHLYQYETGGFWLPPGVYPTSR